MTEAEARAVHVGDLVRFHGQTYRVERTLIKGFYPPYFFLEGLKEPVSYLACGKVEKP